jgi:hypothetical protein
MFVQQPFALNLEDSVEKESSYQTANVSGTPTKTNGKWKSPNAMGDNVAGAVSDFQERLISTSKVAYDKFIDMAGDAVTKANRRAEVFTRQYPVQVAAGALAVGFLLGVTLFRRKA